MKAVRVVIAIPLYVGQYASGLVAMAIHKVARLLMRPVRFIEVWIYYRTFVQLRRKVMGEPAWKDIDVRIGIAPPAEVQKAEEEKWRSEIAKLPKCPACGQPTVPIMTVVHAQADPPPGA